MISPSPFIRKRFTLSSGQFSISLGDKTALMGIVNITPDSFSQDGCMTVSSRKNKNFTERAVILAQQLIREGADIIDIGGESSRPGSKPISAREELKRILPAIQILAQKKIPISVDTYKPEVAQAALEAGAVIVNTIKGLTPSKTLLKMIKNYNAVIVLMHMRGTPQTMQRRIHFQQLMPEIYNDLKKSMEFCLEMGIKLDRIIVDPGLGFGKTPEQNLAIINRLEELKNLNRPVLIGPSRKSFIGKILNQEVGKRLEGTKTAVIAGILRGAHMVRIHDVKAIQESVRVTDAVLKENVNLHV